MPSPAELAAQRGRQKRAAAAERTRRLRSFDAAVREEKASRPKGVLEAAGPEPLRILAEGDSWFDFPFGGSAFRRGDVIARLGDMIPYPILNQAVRGDEARQMLGVAQRQRLESLLRDARRGFNVVLFSGGGNDIVGDPLCLWLNDRVPLGGPETAINSEAFAHAIGIVEVAYRQLVALRDRVQQEQPARRITLFFHQYDFALPSGKGVCGFGPWLKPSLAYRGWADRPEATLVVRALLSGLAQMLDRVARSSSDVFIVQTQGTLGADDWHDELHPNRTGFGKIATLFSRKLREVFPASF